MLSGFVSHRQEVDVPVQVTNLPLLMKQTTIMILSLVVGSIFSSSSCLAESSFEREVLSLLQELKSDIYDLKSSQTQTLSLIFFWEVQELLC
jgi:hypothetical protein